MDLEKYISSGILELYLTGTLSEKENFDVYQNAMKHPKIKEEIGSIEAAILEVSKAVIPEISQSKGFNDLKDRIGQSEAAQLPKKTIDWSNHISRAATVFFGIGVLWFFTKATWLKSDISRIDQQKQILQNRIAEISDSLENSYELVRLLKGKNTLVIPLSGQEMSPTSKAKVYWKKEETRIYLDAQGLPNPPAGFVYQFWSLKLDPYTPTSLGLLDGFVESEYKIFIFGSPNDYELEAFEITLEPKGGSTSPTAKKLVTLGTISSTLASGTTR